MANADSFFGGDYAAGGYATCVKYGIGREVIAKMLEGTETKSAVRYLSLIHISEPTRPY